MNFVEHLVPEEMLSSDLDVVASLLRHSCEADVSWVVVCECQVFMCTRALFAVFR